MKLISAFVFILKAAIKAWYWYHNKLSTKEYKRDMNRIMWAANRASKGTLEERMKGASDVEKNYYDIDDTKLH